MQQGEHMRRGLDDDGTDDNDLTLPEAAVHVGMSPAAFAELLDRGVVASYLGRDGRHRRVTLAALEEHRASRFALRQHLTQQARARRRPEYGPESTTADVVIVA
jgi:hypothetical protein